jgi:hypothetical protein
VVGRTDTYVSSEDIDKGARWSTDIAKELEDSTFGILCVTRDNLDAPWLIFEAGALSKMMDKSSVCPFIFNLKRAEVKGPILQFQSAIFEKDDVKKLVLSLNKACGETQLKENLLLKAFEVWWPNLEESLKKIKTEKPEQQEDTKSKNIDDEMLEEILELTRSNQKILRSPDILLPLDYYEYLNNNVQTINLSRRNRDLIEERNNLYRELEHRFMQLREIVETYRSEKRNIDDDFIKRIYVISDLIQHILYLSDK